MPIIMTAHMAQSSARCLPSQIAVLIHALAPVIGPYIARAITAIHIQETSGTIISSTAAGVRSNRSADSRIVRGRSSRMLASTIGGSLRETGGQRKRTRIRASPHPERSEILTYSREDGTKALQSMSDAFLGAIGTSARLLGLFGRSGRLSRCGIR